MMVIEHAVPLLSTRLRPAGLSCGSCGGSVLARSPWEAPSCWSCGRGLQPARLASAVDAVDAKKDGHASNGLAASVSKAAADRELAAYLSSWERNVAS